jgi:hypothetical protein
MCITGIIRQQIWGYEIVEKLDLRVREQKRSNATAMTYFTHMLRCNIWYRILFKDIKADFAGFGEWMSVNRALGEWAVA